MVRIVGFFIFKKSRGLVFDQLKVEVMGLKSEFFKSSLLPH